MKTGNFLRRTGVVLAVIALVLALGAGSALAASVPICNSFDVNGVPIYSSAVPPDTTGTTNCTDYFGAPNWATSPLPASPITGFTMISGGSGYVNPVVVIADPTGAGATATATATSGVITAVTVGTPGSNYVIPKVSIVDVGAGGTIGAPTCGGVSQPACGSGAMATAVLGGPYTGGMLKFQDAMKDLKTVIATPDTTTFPGSDYYEIALVQYSEKMHSSLPPTTLRGYVQFPSGSNSCSATPVAPPSYLGPVILAVKDRPVRVKFTNCLPTGAGGNLFIPADNTYMGAGMGPGGASYTENRATLHLHGGATPWISDGTPHQWTVPVGEGSALQKGDSVAYVPDMFFDSTGLVTSVPQCSSVVTTNCWPNAVPAGLSNNPGQGALTFFWTNQQGGRLMFYHDHAYGLTRLNVYAGEAAGYLLVDPAEEDKLAAGTVPGTVGTTPDLTHLIPLVIQDKSFVPSSTQLAAQDPTWAGNFGATPLSGTGSNGDLWFPHVYMPNQNPNDPTMASGVGHWDYGPWFFPPQTSLTAATPSTAVTTTCTSAAFPGQVLAPTSACPTCGCPIIPNPSGTPEAFMDTPVVNGVAYPVLHVAPAAYRFKILTAGNDRSLNLSWYVADATQGNTEVAMLPAVPPSAGSPLPLCTAINPVAVPALDLGLATALLDNTGKPLNGTGLPANCWPNFGPQQGIPAPQTMWAADGRAGGVPDPRTAGPPWVQIGTEGGILPAPVVIPATPVNYEQNVRSITIGSVAVHGLWVGPAERADVVVDFSQFAGKTLILYNDAPAPAPASDSRLDYFTGDGDQSPIGGAPNTPAGYGPNTRTIMQVVVDATAPNAVPFDLNALKTAFASTPTATGIFASTQPTTIVPQAPYNSAYNASFTNTYMGIQSDTLTFAPLAPLTFDQSCTATAPNQCAVLDHKAIQELFTLDYGRMNATLGVELPLTNFLTQTTIPYGYVDPPTEIVREGDTQLWRITHNGVDSHFIHFHLFNVQVVNRVGWDGSNRPIDPNELGWKDTVRMNPLEDILVALQPITPLLPFPIPDSVRNMDVTMGPSQFTNVDPTNRPVTVSNIPINFGWEYVWHCHILGHEENDMMRPIIFQVAPPAPSSLIASGSGPVALAWVDNSANEDSYTVERDITPAFTSPTFLPVNGGNSTGFSTLGYGQTVSFTDSTAVNGQTYYYRVQASDSFTPVASVYPPSFQPQPMSSAWSNIATTGPAAIASVSPSSLAFGNQQLNTTSAPQIVTLSSIGSLDLLVSSITLTGANAGDYSILSDTCTGTVVAGTSCTVSVTFTPSVLGARAASLTIVSNSAVNPTLSVPMTGTGTTAIAGVAPASLAFGNQSINTISTAQTVTLSNTGNAPLSIVSIATGTTVFIQSNGCGTTLAGGASCAISVSFAPVAMGAQTGALAITSNDPVNPTLTVALSGTGTSPVAVVTPASLTFGNQAVNTLSTAQTVTLTNTGNGTLSLVSIGTGTLTFLDSSNCGPSLAAGSSCAIDVYFMPMSLGAHSGTLTIVSNDPVNPTLMVALSGTGASAIAGVAPTSLAFGNQPMNTISTGQTVTLSNTGAAPLSIYSIATGTTIFAQNNGCGTSLLAGTSCTISVTFAPTAAGVQNGSLTIVSNDPVNPTLTVALSGTGTTPVAGVAPTSLVFGTQLMNTTSSGQIVTVSNTGLAPLSIVSVSTGTNVFTATNGCGTTLAAGANCTISVTFRPTTMGPWNGSLTIASNDPVNPSLTVSLSGTGTAPIAGVAPATLAFSSQPLNTTSAAQTVTLSNTGTAPLGLTSIAATGDFAQTNACGTTLAAGANCTISVTFTPTVRGTRTGSVSITSNDPLNPTLTVALSGTGSAPLAGVTPASLNFGNTLLFTTSAAQTVTLSNTGNAALSISSIGLTGANAGDFAQTNNCGTSLAAGSTCSISAAFTPTVGGARTASLSISSNDLANPTLNVSLNGTGTSVALSTSALVFGPQAVGTTSSAQAVTIVNTGSTALSISGITIGGANATDFTRTTTCSTSLAAGSSCRINVRFAPTATGTRTAILSIADSDPSSPQTVSLTGTGAAPINTVSPLSLSFSSPLNTTSAGQVVTITNTGTASMTINGLPLGGTNPGQFSRTQTCGAMPATLAAGASCTATVTFRPTSTGTKSATLTVSVASPAVNQTVTLSGTVLVPVSTVSPTTLAFGTQAVGTTSATQSVTVTNTGTAAMRLNGISIGGNNPGQFAQTNNCGPFPATIAVGASCTANVVFKPTSTGNKSATLNVNAASPAGTKSVALTGTGQ